MEDTQIAAATEPSMADIRSMLSPEKADVPVAEDPKPPAEPAAEVKPPVEAKPEEKQQPAPTEETELPEGVKKRIAKEVEQTLAIKHAISERKAAQAELDKLPAKPGSEPAPNTAAVKPVRPDLAKFEGTWEEYNAALAKYESEHEVWLIAETERKSDERWKAKQAEQEQNRALEAARTKHGADFDAHRQAVAAGTPEGLQFAISALDDWAGVVSHLAKNQPELQKLTATFSANPVKAIAELGRLEDRLQQAAKPPAEEKPKPAAAVLPDPIAKPGGSAAATGGVNFETAKFSTVKKELTRMLKAG